MTSEISKLSKKSAEDIQGLKSDISSALKQVQQLELENQIMKEKMAPLIYENEELRAELQDRKRLRNEIKSLLATLDGVFMTHINKLNKRNNARSLSVKSLKAYEDIEQVLADVYAYDLDAFYNKNSIGMKDRPLFIIVAGVYGILKKAGRLLLIGMWRCVKLIKRVIRRK